MKKLLIVTLILAIVLFSGCDMLGDLSNKNFSNKNIKPVQEKPGYYTDEKLAFCAEIRGSYKSDRPFTLDENNENLRVWDDMYLYEGDYFQMIVNNSSQIFYSVQDQDLEYVTLEDKLAQATINEGKSGIYKIVFDLSTKIFHLQFKGEITTPVYEKMDGCDVYTLSSEFTPLVPNPNNSEELMIANYTIKTGELVSFYNHGNVHLSNYKVILDQSVQGRYATALEDGDRYVKFLIGGSYNLYVNPTTYQVRVELTNPDTAHYTLYVFKSGESEPTKLTPANANQPYLFEYQVTLRRNASVPIFTSESYAMYSFSVAESEYFDSKYEMFTTEGTYLLQINLKTFTITVNYIPQ
ncbi:MAG: hypothetical protein IKA29_00115 [Clostridia bacterium]|nr:hypothetical protein [Clostridia bacterium]